MINNFYNMNNLEQLEKRINVTKNPTARFFKFMAYFVLTFCSFILLVTSISEDYDLVLLPVFIWIIVSAFITLLIISELIQYFHDKRRIEFLNFKYLLDSK